MTEDLQIANAQLDEINLKINKITRTLAKINIKAEALKDAAATLRRQRDEELRKMEELFRNVGENSSPPIVVGKLQESVNR